jgi:hypothetical protein
MAAYIWNANPGRWNVVPPSLTSWDALKAYVTDPSKYVYWSTPVRQKDIRVGDEAIIWRTKYHHEAAGIIAIGRVEERPRDLTASTTSLFAFPKRLPAPGWDEAKAPSRWKTGIRIERGFWNSPLPAAIRTFQGTVRELAASEIKVIENEVERLKSV